MTVCATTRRTMMQFRPAGRRVQLQQSDCANPERRCPGRVGGGVRLESGGRLFARRKFRLDTREDQRRMMMKKTLWPQSPSRPWSVSQALPQRKPLPAVSGKAGPRSRPAGAESQSWRRRDTSAARRTAGAQIHKPDRPIRRKVHPAPLLTQPMAPRSRRSIWASAARNRVAPTKPTRAARAKTGKYRQATALAVSASGPLSQDQRARSGHDRQGSSARATTNISSTSRSAHRTARRAYRGVPEDVVEIVPQYEGYDYVMVGDEILIIDPNSLDIVAVIEA